MSSITEMITTRETDTKMALCDECGGLGEYETQHPMWGAPFCPEAYVIVMGDADLASAHPCPEEGGSRRAAGQSGWWFIEPAVGRVAHGVPNRVDRLRALGNAVVPQIPQIIGEAILEAIA